MTTAERNLNLLIAAIRRLAAAPAEQRAYLSELGVEGLADELALEFDDALAPLAPQFGELGIAASVIARIEAMDDALRAMSANENEALWRTAALDGPEWSGIRRAAAEILALLQISSS